jgi:tetratricopeptide (TPR) repeat protein
MAKQLCARWLLMLLLMMTAGGCAASRRANPTAWQHAYNAGRTAYERGHYARAEKLFAAAVKEAEQFGGNDPRLARSLNDLAAAYAVQGKYADAEPLYKRSLAILEKVYGPNAPSVATALSNYAQLLRATNRTGEAAELEARAAAIQAKAH